MERKHPFRTELGAGNAQCPRGSVEIGDLQSEQLADAHPRAGSQPDQGNIGRRSQRSRRTEAASAAEKRTDLRGSVDMGDDPAMSGPQEMRWRNLRAGIESAAKTRESPEQLQAFGVVEAGTILGHRSPLKRESHPERLPRRRCVGKAREIH